MNFTTLNSLISHPLLHPLNNAWTGARVAHARVLDPAFTTSTRYYASIIALEPGIVAGHGGKSVSPRYNEIACSILYNVKTSNSFVSFFKNKIFRIDEHRNWTKILKFFFFFKYRKYLNNENLRIVDMNKRSDWIHGKFLKNVEIYKDLIIDFSNEWIFRFDLLKCVCVYIYVLCV